MSSAMVRVKRFGGSRRGAARGAEPYVKTTHGRFSVRRALVSTALALAGVLAACVALAHYATDANLAVGYCPKQAVEFSHKLHAGDLGIDCRMCHGSAWKSPFAALPTSEQCMTCHRHVLPESVKLLPLRATFVQGQSIAWVRVHNLPDFARFDHSAHLAAGVGCSTCHGRVDRMVETRQVVSLSMAWCRDCHIRPGPELQPTSAVTQMGWTSGGAARGNAAALAAVSPPTFCSGCHQ